MTLATGARPLLFFHHHHDRHEYTQPIKELNDDINLQQTALRTRLSESVDTEHLDYFFFVGLFYVCIFWHQSHVLRLL